MQSFQNQQYQAIFVHQLYLLYFVRLIYLYQTYFRFDKDIARFSFSVETLLNELALSEESGDMPEAKKRMGSVLGQEYDPESSLYYYNARYYDPTIGVFTTADTVVPSSTDPLAYNRYMYVRGNPVIYTDPSGHSWSSFWNGVKKFFKKVVKVVSTVVSAILSPITAVASGIQSAITGQSFSETFNNNFNGVTSAVGAAIMLPIAVNPLLTGLIGGFESLANGGNFFSGFGVERFNYTLKRSFRRKLKDGMRISQIQKIVDEFLDWYNKARPHLSLNSLTPYQMFSQNLKIETGV